MPGDIPHPDIYEPLSHTGDLGMLAACRREHGLLPIGPPCAQKLAEIRARLPALGGKPAINRASNFLSDRLLERALPCVTRHRRRNTSGKCPCRSLLRRLSCYVVSHRAPWRRLCGHILHHAQGTCHGTVLRTLVGAPPLLPPHRLKNGRLREERPMTPRTRRQQTVILSGA